LSQGLGELSKGQAEVIQRMQHSAKRLSRMADAMFELGVKGHLKRQPDFQRADFERCVNQAIHEIQPFAADRRIPISVDLTAISEPLYFDPGQVEQLMLNLLDNACRFTPRGGSIAIRGYPFFQERRNERLITHIAHERRGRASHEPNSFRVDLRDSGSPIPVEHLQLVFEEYTSYAGKHDRSGGGLGLAMCRLIVNQHEGQIWAQNTEMGPMFSFTLPLRTGPGKEPEHRGVKADTEVVSQ
jgi:signal transduction histidine kinase